MKLLDLLSDGFETETFPESECTLPNKREAGVMDGNAWYLCLWVDKRFSDEGGISVLKPYTSENLPECIAEGEPKILFGWADKNGNTRDHFEKNIHDDYEVVIAWKRLESSVDLRELAGVEEDSSEE